MPILPSRIAGLALSLASLPPTATHAALVGWWPFDEISGQTAANRAASGTPLDALLQAGASFVPDGGRFGGCVTLDGASGYISVPSAPSIAFGPNQAFTIATWFRSDFDHSDTRGIMGKGYHTTPHNPDGYYLLRIDGSAQPEFDSREGAGATPRVKIDLDTAVDDGEWHHVAATRHPVANEIRVYLDGSPAATYSTGAGDGDWAMGANDDPLVFGRYLDRFTTGSIDDAAIWDEALDATAIAAVFVGGVAAASGPDSDGDGLPDPWETEHFNGLGEDDSGDADEDGLTNLQEYNKGTDPNDPDSDGDGLEDGPEFNIHSTNPSVPDSDGDGLTDGEEINSYATDPNDPDSDGDGLTDFSEINDHSTDPNDPDSDGDGYSDAAEVAASTAPGDPDDFPRFPTLDGVFLNEFLASNRGGLTDVDGDASDWVELWNPTGAAVDISGWFLSDDPTEPDKWEFPAGTVLPAGGFQVVFASGKDRNAGGELHTNFRIDRAIGGSLALSNPIAPGSPPVTVSAIQAYPDQREDVSFGYVGAPPTGLGYFIAPTPGAANGPAVIGFVDDTKFTSDRGFYDAAFVLKISSDTPGASLVVTTDGSAPGVDPPNGTVFPPQDELTGPTAELTINTTTTVRAIATKPGHQPTGIDSHTYIFTAHVLSQSAPPAGTWRPWGDPGPSWAMNPAVVNHPDPASKCVAADLLTIPTLSISLPFDEMWGNGGIYIAGEGVERACGIEYINPEGDPDAPNAERGFEVDGTVQIVGGSSTGRWKSNKLSMRLKFSPDLQAAVFDSPDVPFGPDATDRFDTLVLDARLNNVWNHPSHSQRVKGQYVRDQYVADLQNASGGTAPHGRHMHVYVAGYYWGMHTVHERPDDNFAATYFGGDNTDYDVVKHDGNTVVQGSRNNFAALTTALRQNLDSRENFDAVESMVDLRDFARYMIVNYFVGNDDWDHHNWYASFNRVAPGARWHFHSWDAEHVLKSVSQDSTSTNNNGKPTGFQHQLARSAEYRLIFADEVQRLFFNEGPMTPESALAHYDRRISMIDGAIRAESARWGDNKRPGEPYLRGVEWLDELETLRTAYFPTRTVRVTNQFRGRGWFPNTPAPAFSVDGSPLHGGMVEPGALLTLSGDGDPIYFKTDGTDPREAWTSVPTGALYSAPLPLGTSNRVKARSRSGSGEWSALSEAVFVAASPAGAANLALSEIMYNPEGADEAGEFIELTNTSDTAIDLSGLRFTAGIEATIAHGTVLEPGATYILARPGHLLAGITVGTTFNGALDNNGEQITLVAADGGTVAEFRYNDGGSWPGGADGAGYSLELAGSGTGAGTVDYNSPLNWRTSATPGGSPGSSEGLTYAAWRVENGLAPGGDGTDFDGDGWADLEEFFFGTDPRAADSGTPLTASPLPDGSGFMIIVPRSSRADAVSVGVESSGDLATWDPAGPDAFTGSSRRSGSTADWLEFTVRTTPGTGSAFGRVKISSAE